MGDMREGWDGMCMIFGRGKILVGIGEALYFALGRSCAKEC